MVLPGNIVPPNAGWVTREIQGLKGKLREGLASVAASFRGTVEDLAGQVAFLQGQTQFHATNATIYNLAISSPRTDYTPAFDADRLASMAVTTSSTGKLLIEAACLWSVYPAANTPIAIDWELYVEILLGDSQVIGPSTGAPQSAIVRSIPAAAGFTNTQSDAVAVRGVVSLSPHTTYEARCRVVVNSLRAGNDLDISPVSLSVTKLGM